MDYNHDIDTANDVASSALERMHALKIAPTPNNFEVWYVYYANLHPDLRAQVDKLMSSNGKLTEDDCKDLHETFLSDVRHQEMYQRAGDQIHSTIQDVSSLMDNVRNVTVEYGGTLEGVSKKLSSVKSGQDLESVVKAMAVDTAKMLEYNRKLEEQIGRSANVMDELKRDLERVRHEAMTDGLTGLANRKAFDEKISDISRIADEEGKIFTLLMIDIDHFKSFNDNFGHQVGDQVLRLVARTLIDGVKGRDTPARYGGEEFSILLPETNLNAGVMVADNLRKAIAGKEIVNRSTGEPLGRITISVGVAQYYVGEKIDDFIERADAALYTAKHNGRNQVAAAPTPHDRAKQAG